MAKLTSDHILLQDGLVAYYDPIDDVTKQITVESAIRLAKVNSDMKKKLVDLQVIDINGNPTPDYAPVAPEVEETEEKE
jgi:hypothetical protein